MSDKNTVESEIVPSEPVTSITQIPAPETTIIKLQDQANEMLLCAEGISIREPADVQNATYDLSIIAKAKRAIEEKRKEYVGPLNDKVKFINETFKLVSDPLNEADKLTRDKILAYNAEQAELRRKEEEVNRLKMEAAQAEAALHGGEIKESVNLIEVTPETPKTTRTEMGTAGQRDNWKYEVTDFAQLPDEYKVADNSMLTAIARRHHDKKQIPGVRFYCEKIIAVRTR